MGFDMQYYPLHVFWSEEDEAYIALAPDLPGCSAAGETEIEALKRARQAITLWLEVSSKAGNPIPQPSKPLIKWAIGF
jgi:predicted RNase H-like HicB family nuclease